MKTKLVTLLNPTNEQLDHYHGNGNIEDVLTVIFKSNADGTVTISSDLQTTCKRAETAINRYFRAIPENHPLRAYWGNEIADIDAIKESLNETGEFAMHDDEYQIYSVGVELNTIDDDDRSYYVWLNYRTTKEQLKMDFPEIMEELEPSSEAESEEERDAREYEEMQAASDERRKNESATDKRINEASEKHPIYMFPYFALGTLRKIKGLPASEQIEPIGGLIQQIRERIKDGKENDVDYRLIRMNERMLAFFEEWMNLTQEAAGTEEATANAKATNLRIYEAMKAHPIYAFPEFEIPTLRKIEILPASEQLESIDTMIQDIKGGIEELKDRGGHPATIEAATKMLSFFEEWMNLTIEAAHEGGK